MYPKTYAWIENFYPHAENNLMNADGGNIMSPLFLLAWDN